MASHGAARWLEMARGWKLQWLEILNGVFPIVMSVYQRASTCSMEDLQDPKMGWYFSTICLAIFHGDISLYSLEK